MDRAVLGELITEVLSEVQEASGREPSVITETTVPTRDLVDFDSVNAVEACAILCDRLSRIGIGKEIPVEVFIVDGEKAASVSSIVTAVLALVEERT